MNLDHTVNAFFRPLTGVIRETRRDKKKKPSQNDMNHNPVVIAPSRFLDRQEFNSLKSAFFDILFGAKCGPEKGRWGER